MPRALQQDYAKLSDEELLHLASERSSLTEEAQSALEEEMRNRNLSAGDIGKHETFWKRNEQREASIRKRKLFGTRSSRKCTIENLVTAFWTAVVLIIIAAIYLSLPLQYRFRSDWQESATYVMFSSVFLIVSSPEWRGRGGFWVSLTLSSIIHLLIVHWWVSRAGTLDGPGHRGDGKFAVLVGMVLFFVIYGVGSLLRLKISGEDEPKENG